METNDYHKLTDKMMNLIDQKKEHNVKYVYYLIALCVSSIGYSMIRTVDYKLKLSLVLWGLSVLSWSVSIYYGLLFLRTTIRAFDYDIGFLITKRETPNAANPVVEKYQGDCLEKLMKCSKWQNRFFIIGMFLFVIWHVLEIVLRSIPNCYQICF